MTAQDSSLRMLIGNITGDLNHLCDSSADIEIDRTITGNIVSVHISTGDYTVTVTPTPTTTSPPPPYLGMTHPPM